MKKTISKSIFSILAIISMLSLSSCIPNNGGNEPICPTVVINAEGYYNNTTDTLPFAEATKPGQYLSLYNNPHNPIDSIDSIIGAEEVLYKTQTTNTNNIQNVYSGDFKILNGCGDIVFTFMGSTLGIFQNPIICKGKIDTDSGSHKIIMETTPDGLTNVVVYLK